MCDPQLFSDAYFLSSVNIYKVGKCMLTSVWKPVYIVEFM